MFALHFVRGMHPELFQENVSGIKEDNVRVTRTFGNGQSYGEISGNFSLKSIYKPFSFFTKLDM